MSASEIFVPAVEPRIVQTALREARAARVQPWKQARLVAERGLRARSDAVMQVLASAALGGGTWEEAVERAVNGRGRMPAVESHPWWAALGRMTMMHAKSERDLAKAVALFDLAYTLDPARPFGRPDYLAYVQALWDTGQRERIAAIPKRVTTLEPGESDFIELNLLAHHEDSEAWITRLNRAVTEPAGLAPISLTCGARTRFDALYAKPFAHVGGDHLITVIMSTFRRGPELQTAVESVLAQTWNALELIIVDDCSGAEYQSVLEQVGALDERIRIVRQAINQGTYLARNRAIQIAQGEYITFQDDDDWSHPERLERQVAPLIADRSVHSTLSYAVQADDDLVFRHASRRTRLMNSSSLMLRKSDLAILGGFDGVRKGADTEFIRRLRVGLPGHQETLPEDLAFVRLTGGSLSRADFRPGWNHPSRSEYAEASQWWHRSIQSGASPRLDAQSATRPFPAPSRFLVNQPEEGPKYHLILAADLASPAVVASPGWALAMAALDAGSKVGVAPIDNPYRADALGRTRITGEVRSLINEGRIERVLVDQEGRSDCLVIDSPVLLEMGDQTAWRVEVDEIQVLCPTPPVESGRPSRWSVKGATQALEAMLPGVPQRWLAANRVSKEALSDLGVGVHGDLIANKPFALQLKQPRPRRVGWPPVIGRVGADGDGTWPGTCAEVMTVYTSDGTFDVRMLGELAPCLYGLHERPAGWLHYRNDDLRLDDFLDQLDVYVHASEVPPTLLEQRVMVRAVGLGKPVVFAGEGADLLGCAVVRCGLTAVVETVEELCESRTRYTATVERAQSVLKEAGLLAVSE